MRTKADTSNLVHAFLLDPFKGGVVAVDIPRNFHPRWRELLDCAYIEHVACHILGKELALWIDEEGLLREPSPYPQFKIVGVNADRPMAGYGLLTGTRGPEVSDVDVTLDQLCEVVHFENWQTRLKTDDYIDQMLRIYLPWP
jgi:hypothetical protein